MTNPRKKHPDELVGLNLAPVTDRRVTITMMDNDAPPPIRNIVVGNHPRKQQQILQQGVVVDTTFHRAVHKIRLSALSHNYSEVESAANRQRCSVIVVVKADGYGHGAIPSAIFLADKIGADAFAVATLEVSVCYCCIVLL